MMLYKFTAEKKAYGQSCLVWVMLFAAVLLMTLVFSCKTVALPTCKHQISVPVVVQVDNNTYYTIQVPFCDTVIASPAKQTNKKLKSL